MDAPMLIPVLAAVLRSEELEFDEAGAGRGLAGCM